MVFFGHTKNFLVCDQGIADKAALVAAIHSAASMAAYL